MISQPDATHHTSSGDARRAVPRGRVYRAPGQEAARPGLIRVGTRGSRLAIAQTTTVSEAIAAATGCDVALVTITTHGDVSRESLSQLGGTGVFVSALREALLAGECDLAVHSLKDLPTGPCPGIRLGAIPERADARDALCARDGLSLSELPAGANVGTGSPRRAAQLRAARPDLAVHDLRGNVDTRLGRVGGDLDAVVLAAAGLDRSGLADAITERFPLATVPTAPGQGALAIEARESDRGVAHLEAALAALDDAEARACATAERVLLGALEAGCAAPVGATAAVLAGRLSLTATVYRLDGSAELTARVSEPWGASGGEAAELAGAAERLGRAAAADLLARGAAELAPLGPVR